MWDIRFFKSLHCQNINNHIKHFISVSFRGWPVALLFTSGCVSSLNIISFSFAKYSVNLRLRIKLWISFSISIAFLFWTGVNFKLMLKTFNYVSVRHLLNKFVALGRINVCLFNWCELYSVHEIKSYLPLHHLIVDVLLPLVYQLLLQFDLVIFFYFFVPDWFNFNHIKCCFKGRLNSLIFSCGYADFLILLV